MSPIGKWQTVCQMACQVAFVGLVAHFVLAARGVDVTAHDVVQSLNAVERDKMVLSVIALMGVVVLATQFLSAITWLMCAAVFGLTAGVCVLVSTVYSLSPADGWVRASVDGALSKWFQS